MQIHLYVVLIPLLLLLAGIFAASEAALFSLSRPQLESLRQLKPGLYKQIRRLTYSPDSLLSTIIIGNECLNILISTFVAELLQFHLTDLSTTVVIILSVLLSSALLLTFSEILPKIIAFRMPTFVASFLVVPTFLAHRLLTPVRKVFLSVSSFILESFGIRASPPSVVNERDFLTLVDVGTESGSLDREEKDLIYNVFDFSDISVASVMTPWEKVFHISDDILAESVLAIVRRHTYSRIPIFSNAQNRVVGILYTKELLKMLLAPQLLQEKEIILRSTFPPYIVSVHKKISKLFREFRLRKVHLALVVDEFGRHLGIITLEDVLNSLFKIRKVDSRGVG